MEEPLTPKKKFQKAEQAALIAVAFCLLQTILKFILAYYSQSLSVLADAYHSLSDILTSALVFIALRLDQYLRQRKPSNQIGWVEHGVTAGIGIFLSISEKCFQIVQHMQSRFPVRHNNKHRFIHVFFQFIEHKSRRRSWQTAHSNVSRRALLNICISFAFGKV